MPILPKERDPRLVTLRRGGTLSDDDHRALMAWSIACAEHVLPLFEREAGATAAGAPAGTATGAVDPRPRDALAIARAWARGEVPMATAHRAAFQANAAGRGLPDAARFAALAAGQAVAVAHVAAHDLGAAAYAIRAVGASVAADRADAARAAERAWQRAIIPAEVRDLVLDDQRRRSALCWNVFDD
ncbi:putative immunity protein [Herbiconiux liangxiaofengii]|uniref:putative immunity protein n=1 Tax=Herbiconiux liangxiaofengii TaxID=3342795 RepID=UPI0035B805C1